MSSGPGGPSSMGLDETETGEIDQSPAPAWLRAAGSTRMPASRAQRREFEPEEERDAVGRNGKRSEPRGTRYPTRGRGAKPLLHTTRVRIPVAAETGMSLSFAFRDRGRSPAPHPAQGSHPGPMKARFRRGSNTDYKRSYDPVRLVIADADFAAPGCHASRKSDRRGVIIATSHPNLGPRSTCHCIVGHILLHRHIHADQCVMPHPAAVPNAGVDPDPGFRLDHCAAAYHNAARDARASPHARIMSDLDIVIDLH